MRKISQLLIILVLAIAANISVHAADKQTYELWTESPYVTSGLTLADINVHRAIKLNEFDTYKLNRLGNNIYLGIAEKKMTDGGASGKIKTSELYAYTILVNNGDYIVLGETSINEEYYWDSGVSLRDISGEVWNTNWYTSRGYQVPYYIFMANGMYSNTSSGYGTDTSYLIITNTGKVCEMTTYHSTTDSPIAYNGLLYLQQDYYKSGTRYYRYTDASGNYQTKLMPIVINSAGELSYDTTNAEMKTLSGTTLNIGQTSYSSVSANIGRVNYQKISGTADLFFTAINVPRYNVSENKTYYDVQISTYRMNNYIMNPLSQKTFQTANTYSQGLNILDLGELDRTYYASKGSSIPRHIVNKNYIVFEDGTISAFDPERINSATYVNGGWNFALYNNRLIVIRDRNGTSSIYKRNPATNYNCYWQVLNYVYFNGTTMYLEADIELPIQSSPHPGQNGYYKSYNSFVAATLNGTWGTDLSYFMLNLRNNVFPDGRRVDVHWTGMGNGMYELWYSIYNSDGTKRATGPTGYSTQFSSVFGSYPIEAVTINNSKFVAYINQIGQGFIKEYYRVAVVEETISGEVSTGKSIGVKNITRPSDADTVPVTSQIDFGQENIPLEYNLSPTLKNEINSIILPDIVIVKKSGYISGTTNTGTTLSSFSNYDYSFGGSYLRVYSNGTNFQWYCHNPENLDVGTYSKSYVIGDKTIYIKVKVIAPPANNGTTSVVF